MPNSADSSAEGADGIGNRRSSMDTDPATLEIPSVEA